MPRTAEAQNNTGPRAIETQTSRAGSLGKLSLLTSDKGISSMFMK